MVEWLEEFLQGWSGACLVVSHDRYFLDRVTSRTLDLSFGQLEDYPAPYARYLGLRDERMARRMQEYEEQQAYIARTEEFIRRYKAGQRSREARGRQTRLERVERIERPQEHEGLNLRLNPASAAGARCFPYRRSGSATSARTASTNSFRRRSCWSSGATGSP
jgi:ATP-binding cassette subfamily F protein 3